METCDICGAAMVYRFNTDRANSIFGSEYAYFCIADATHMVEDLARARAAG
jgi:hypothetical protein